MIYSLAGMLSLITIGAFALRFFARLRALDADYPIGASPVNLVGRYRPMLRLLAEDDFRLIAGNPKLVKRLRTERHKLFRDYLRCLTREYGRLLSGIRLVMVHSRVDRPDLARALATNRMLFALAICKIEFRLTMQSLGVGRVDISAVVEAFDSMRERAAALSALPIAA